MKKAIISSRIAFRPKENKIVVTVRYADGRTETATYDPSNPLHVAIFRNACKEDPPTPAQRAKMKQQRPPEEPLQPDLFGS